MTTLEITPRISDKTARFKGAVAAGEHVAVTIKGGAEWLGDDNGEHLTFRVLDLVTGRTLAVFPRPAETLEEGETPDAWSAATEDANDLYCELNLNTTRMVDAARHMLRVPVLFVLGDTDAPRTLYFRDRHEVEFWPERVGDDTPYDLDKWPKQIDEWTELVSGFGTRLATAEANILQAESRVDTAINAIPQTVETAVTQSNSGKADKVANATSGNLAALDANGNLADSGKKPTDFADATQFATHRDNTNIHFSAAERAKLNGIAVGAQVNVVETVKRNGVALPVTGKAVNIAVPTKTSDLQNDGDGNSSFATTGALGNESSRAQTIESELRADVTSAQSAILDRYTKAETNALVSGAVSGVFVVAQSLPATGETNKIYLVPKSGGETGNVRDEYMWVNGAWELIGSTRVDLSNYYDKTAADGRFVQKETGKGLVAVDSALSQTSENPVQNKVVSKALYTGFTEWVCEPAEYDGKPVEVVFDRNMMLYVWRLRYVSSGEQIAFLPATINPIELVLEFSDVGITATRHLITPTKTSQLTNDGAPNGGGTPYATTAQVAVKQDALSSAQLGYINAVPNKADKAVPSAAGNLAALNAQGNLADSGVKPSDFAAKSDLPYAMVTPGEWEFSGLPNGVTAVMQYIGDNDWKITLSNGDHQNISAGGENAMSVEFPASEWMEGIATYSVTATRASLPGHLLDRANNLIDATTGNVTLTLPPFVAGKVRDLLVACTIGLDTNDEPWSVILQGQGSEAPGGADEISFKAEGDNASTATFPVPDAAGDWWYSLTERAPHVFAVSLKQLQSVSQPTQGGS